VMDFVLLHAEIGGRNLRWYVFNLADVAIVAGVVGLLYESLQRGDAAKAP
jgi:signal peptidase II